MAITAPSVADHIRYRELLDSLAQPAALIRRDHRIVGANRAYRRRYAGGDDVRGRFCYSVSHRARRPCHESGVGCPLRQVLETRKCCRSLHVHHAADGRQQDEISFFPVIDAQGQGQLVLEIICPDCNADVTSGADIEMVGHSAPFNRMMGLVAQVARSDTTVLLLGESGTGKELAARAIHKLSHRASGSFVPLACTEISESLLESELFGHEKGSFTGASGRKIGLIEASHGGTLLLDEIGDLSPRLQVKLLRVLDKGMFRRVGSTTERTSDFRLIAATHRDLLRMVAEDKFRHDLYYRISAFPISIPPLRERIEDLPLLLDALRRRLGCGRDCRPDGESMKLLLDYEYPGNVRELHNILQRACLLADGETIEPRHLPPTVGGVSSTATSGGSPGIFSLTEMELRYVRWAAATFSGTRQELAEQLGLSERSLYRKLRSARSRS